MKKFLVLAILVAGLGVLTPEASAGGNSYSRPQPRHIVSHSHHGYPRYYGGCYTARPYVRAYGYRPYYAGAYYRPYVYVAPRYYAPVRYCAPRPAFSFFFGF